MLLRRLLLTKEIELYEIKRTLYGDVLFYLLLVDMKRASCLEDFPYLDEEDFESRDNYIKALIVYDQEMSEAEKELTYEIVSGFLEDKEDCDWNVDYVKYDFRELKLIGVNTQELIPKINRVMSSVKIGKQISIKDKDSFKYLMQS